MMRLDRATAVIPLGIGMGLLVIGHELHRQRLGRGALPGAARRAGRLPGGADERAAAAPRPQPDGRRALDRGAELQRAGLHPGPGRVLRRHDQVRPLGLQRHHDLRPRGRRHHGADPALACRATCVSTARRSSACWPSRAAMATSRGATASARARAGAGPADQRLRLGRVVVAVAPARGARPAPAVGTAIDLHDGGAAITLWRPAAWGQLLRTPALWVLVLAAGTTNATFNWGVTIGDVVRVVLLFYLMPLWAVLLARLLLGEPLTRRRRAARGAGAGRRGHRAAARAAAAGRCRARWPSGWAWSAASASRSTT